MNKITLIVFGIIIIYSTIFTVLKEGILCPILLIDILFAFVWIYLLKIELYSAIYIFIDMEKRTIDLLTKHKGSFKYDFSQIYVVTRKNYGAQFQFADGKRIEFNKHLVEIETTERARMKRNVEKEDLPGVYFDERL